MEEKKERKTGKFQILHFFGTPYVQHLGRDLKNHILTILKTHSEFLILKFSGSTFVLVKKLVMIALQNRLVFKKLTKINQWVQLRFTNLSLLCFNFDTLSQGLLKPQEYN